MKRLVWHLAAMMAVHCLLLVRVYGQTGTVPYTLNVAVDEVSVTFHAADFHGVPMDDLTVADVRVTDNGKRPRQIVSFEVHRALPVRVGILVDTSRSVLEDLRRNQWVAMQYLQHLFAAPGDRGFVLRFDSQDKVVQDWTGDAAVLQTSVRTVAANANSRMGGTALFDAVYRACRDQFGRTDKVEAGNFILLFSDGVDNASHALLEDDIRMCQSTNTAVMCLAASLGTSFRRARRSCGSWRRRVAGASSSSRKRRSDGATCGSWMQTCGVSTGWCTSPRD